MSQEHEAYWREAQRQFPDWPIFQRLELNKQDRRAHEEAREKSKFLWEIIFSIADEIEESTEGGITSYTAIFKRESILKKANISKSVRRRWWQFW